MSNSPKTNAAAPIVLDESVTNGPGDAIIMSNSPKVNAVSPAKLDVTNAPGDGMSPLVPPSYRPSSPLPSSATPCTRAFYEKNLINLDEKLNDGFYDCGRSVPTLPSLNVLRTQQAHNGREVILLDTASDPDLCATLEKIYATLANITDMRSKIFVLCLLVSNYYGGVNNDLIHNTEAGILNLKKKLNTNVLPIGKLQYGVCRHRAVIFKYVCDRVGIPCRLVRGDYFSEKGTEGHAWNVVSLNGKFYLCDIMHDPGSLFDENSEKAEHYKRITKTGGIMSYAGGPGMQSLPLPAHMPYRVDETREQKLERMVYALQEEVAIKDVQLEKLATKLLDVCPSI